MYTVHRCHVFVTDVAWSVFAYVLDSTVLDWTDRLGYGFGWAKKPCIRWGPGIGYFGNISRSIIVKYTRAFGILLRWQQRCGLSLSVMQQLVSFRCRRVLYYAGWQLAFERTHVIISYSYISYRCVSNRSPESSRSLRSHQRSYSGRPRTLSWRHSLSEVAHSWTLCELQSHHYSVWPTCRKKTIH